MAYYDYHGRIKKRIQNGELVGATHVLNYKGIGDCMVLMFKTYPEFRPIRPHRYEEYRQILRECGFA